LLKAYADAVEKQWKIGRIVNWKGVPTHPHATAALDLGEWKFSVAPVGRLANRPKYWAEARR
jgi:hypothetical protein